LPCFCARFNSGAGAASLYVPRYIAEVAPPALRGWLGSMNQVGLHTWQQQQQQQQRQGSSQVTAAASGSVGWLGSMNRVGGYTWWLQQQQEGSSQVTAATAAAGGCVGGGAAYALGSSGRQEQQGQKQFHQQHLHLTLACDWLGSMNQVGLLT
jgi:hypothetical protein